MSKLGFTWYPENWWASDAFYDLEPDGERYLYLECLWLMYKNDGYLTLSREVVEKRLRMKINPELWEKITQRFVKTEKGLTHDSVNKRLKKASISRKNGQNGGRPSEARNPENPAPKPSLKPERERERESKRETERESEIELWRGWGDLIVQDRDQYWQNMRGRKVGADEMAQFVSVAIRNNWKMTTQQQFRNVLQGFSPIQTQGQSTQTFISPV